MSERDREREEEEKGGGRERGGVWRGRWREGGREGVCVCVYMSTHMYMYAHKNIHNTGDPKYPTQINQTKQEWMCLVQLTTTLPHMFSSTNYYQTKQEWHSQTR